MPPTPSQQTCGKVRIRNMNRRFGRIESVQTSCGTYGHEPCAVAVIEAELKRFKLAATRSPIWYAYVTEDEWDSHRVSDRLSRKRRHDGDGYVWVARHDSDGIMLFSTLPLGGRLTPASMAELPPVVVTRVFVQATRLPGVRRIIHSDGWPNEEDDDDDASQDDLGPVRFGVFGEVEWDEIVEEALTRIEVRYGIRLESLDGWDGPVSLDDKTRCLKEVADEHSTARNKGTEERWP